VPRKRFTGRLVLLAVVASACGCAPVGRFPHRPIRAEPLDDGGRVLLYDTDGDRRADYQQRMDATGRKVELRFEATDERPLRQVRLDALDADSVPHFIIALDGVPYSIVRELYDKGCFRLFYPPSRLISCFPSMTDLAFWRIFGGAQPIAFQAEYFDRRANRIVKGDEVYLSGANADWARKLDYRCSFTMDALAYVIPQVVFDHELRGMADVLQEVQSGTVIVYSVGTAGLGTQGGRSAIVRYLRRIDRFCEQIVHDRQGRVKITILADHGHNMSGRGRVSFKTLLAEAGYKLTDRLLERGDVVAIQYGMVTYAAFFTDDPAGVASVLLQDPAVTLACYRKDDSIVVRTLDGYGRVTAVDGRYGYQVEYGDPLRLQAIIERLRADDSVVEQDGSTALINDRALFEATVEHIYPDPLRRIWLAFNGLVAKPPDIVVCLEDGWCHGSAFFDAVIGVVCLEDGWCHGSAFFDAVIGGASSTHGSLNQINSATIVMTMRHELPGAMRLEEVMQRIGAAGD